MYRMQQAVYNIIIAYSYVQITFFGDSENKVVKTGAIMRHARVTNFTEIDRDYLYASTEYVIVYTDSYCFQLCFE